MMGRAPIVKCTNTGWMVISRITEIMRTSSRGTGSTDAACIKASCYGWFNTTKSLVEELPMAEMRFSEAVAQSDHANRELLKGNAQPLEELYAHDDEITVLGGFGGFERGWAEVGPRLEWAASQFKGGTYERKTISMVEGADLAYTVSIETNRVREL